MNLVLGLFGTTHIKSHILLLSKSVNLSKLKAHIVIVRICASRKTTLNTVDRPLNQECGECKGSEHVSWGNGEIVGKGLSRVARKRYALSFSVMSHVPSFPPSLYTLLAAAAAMEIPGFHKNRAVLAETGALSHHLFPYASEECTHTPPPTQHMLYVTHSCTHTLKLTAAYNAPTDGWQHVCGYHSDGRQGGQNLNFLLAGER